MEMDRLRIGVIGLGWFGEIHCDAIIGIPNLELAALCTRTPDRLKAMSAKFGVKKTTRDYRDLLADPDIDAVSIVTMWDQHTEPAVAALDAGKHVFLEKPMASATPASSISRTRFRTSALCPATSCTARTPPTGRCSMACAAARCGTSSRISPPAR
jgi:hypothetical protein